MACAASASTSTSMFNCYEVFLNHRGVDVKKTFASHLYRRLCRDNKYRIFLDKEEMQVGQEINPQIERAIATASVHIAIFSPRYAESRWCLEELVLMLKARLESKADVITVFHHVKPSDLRLTRDGEGAYVKAFRKFETKQRDPGTIEIWRKALSEAANISGLELETYNDDEGVLVDSVALEVDRLMKRKVRQRPLYVAKHPTGLEEKLEDFRQKVLLQQQQHSEKGKVFGIVGSCGVGKTTLAKEFYNRKRSEYDRSCFLEDVREISLTSLQQKLVEELSLDPVKHSNRLIIVDDVDNEEQLPALFSSVKDVLSSDSLILVTSCNKQVLTCSGIGEAYIYKLEGLDREHSEKLFCLHAFDQPYPAKGFEKLVTEFLDISDGLPLSLRALGAQLNSKRLEYWNGQLRKILGLVLPHSIECPLKSSYDSLDEQEKEVFLDIACFFIKEDKDMAVRLWDASNWGGLPNLQNLENKFLIEIDSKKCIRMHNHFRDLGRCWAEKEPTEAGLRIWCPTRNELSIKLLSQPFVRGINTQVQGTYDQSICNNLFKRLKNPSVDMSTLRLLRAEGDCLESIQNRLTQSTDLLWLRWDKFPYDSLPLWIPKGNLRVVQVTGDRLKLSRQSENEAPLKWENLEKLETEDTIELLAENISEGRSFANKTNKTNITALA